MANKTVAHRIAFYTGKLADYVSVHPAKARPRRHKYRQQRLKQYKIALHILIEEHQNKISAALQGK
ncbi:hypothetical protein J2S74_002278 [Evansella vedderi]|uniref:Uncharacterized protein n=1 Tax=Evansella vedderi TaxID=38282 RepID=A0ABT9ZUH2_9BACI|nr:hypothetical protein [Evansella vedderi]MDQ0254896.1 hypothetical protein [Evansella vedderi]